MNWFLPHDHKEVEISDFWSDEVLFCVHLNCATTWCGKWVPLFQRKWTASFCIVVADGKAESTSVLKIEALFSSESLVPTHQTTQYRNYYASWKRCSFCTTDVYWRRFILSCCRYRMFWAPSYQVLKFCCTLFILHSNIICKIMPVGESLWNRLLFLMNVGICVS